MRRRCALALALALAAALALGIAGAAGAAQAADAPPRRRRRPGGGRARGDAAVDARGRPAECAACHRVVVHLDEELVPELDAAAARQRASGKRAHWGLLEETIERAVEGACSTTAVQADPRVRAACTRFLDSHEGEVVRAFYRYATDEPALNLAAELCAAECPSELAALTVQQVERLELDIAQEEAGPSSAPPGTPTRVLSEVPTPAAEQGALARVVAADVISFAMKDAERDIVLYVAAPADGGAPLFDAALRPRLQRVAEELSHRSATLGFGVLDVQRNELPPVIAVIAEVGSARTHARGRAHTRTRALAPRP